MLGNILTPVTVWSDFKIDHVPSAKTVEKKTVGDIALSKLYIDGKKTEKGKVEIYAFLAKNTTSSTTPTILVFPDFERGIDEKAVIDLAKKGFSVMAIDLYGVLEGAKHYSRYPSDISYANYEQVKDSLNRIKSDVAETCWYEWAVAGRYALEYLKNQSFVKSIGGLGVSIGAGVLWQVAFNNRSFSALTFIRNAGWSAYLDIPKFGLGAEPQFTDQELKYVAGIEPQTYAQHVCCPTLTLTATNDTKYDCDRALDTVSRIPNKYYRAVNYSVGDINQIGSNSFDMAIKFFDRFMNDKNEENEFLPEEPFVAGEIVKGNLVVTATVTVEKLKKVELYVSEQTVKQSSRAWKCVKPIEKDGKGQMKFSYAPYYTSQMVVFFVKAVYENGFEVCSNIACKRFKEKEVLLKHRDKIVYSGRERGAESVFTTLNAKTNGFCVDSKNGVSVKKGPMSIEGVTSKGGLLTFKIGADRYKPDEYAMLMMDLFVKESVEITVSLISKYFGEKCEYFTTAHIKGGKIWHNLCLEMSRFKTAEGRILKSYKDIEALSITCTGEFLVNNVLWV